MKAKIILAIIAVAMSYTYVPKMYEAYLMNLDFWERIKDHDYLLRIYGAGFPVVGLFYVFLKEKIECSGDLIGYLFGIFKLGCILFMVILVVDMLFWDSHEWDYAGDLIELHSLLGAVTFAVTHLVCKILHVFKGAEAPMTKRENSPANEWDTYMKEAAERKERLNAENEEKLKAEKRAAEERLKAEKEEKLRSTVLTYGTFTDSRDGNVYKTIKIGNQVWMAENLRYKGDRAEQGSFAYDDDSEMEEKYGRLYTWSAAMNISPKYDKEEVPFPIKKKMEQGNYRGIAPEGWHIPTKKEFETLLNYVRNNMRNSDAAQVSAALRLPGEWDSKVDGKNWFGFSALPAGSYSSEDREFSGLGSRADFWSSSELDSDDAYGLSITYIFDASIDSNKKYNAYSIRCLQD